MIYCHTLHFAFASVVQQESKHGMQWDEIFIPMLPNQDNHRNGFNFQFCSVSGWSVTWLFRKHLGKYRNEIFLFNIMGLVDNLLCSVIYLIQLFLHNTFKTSTWKYLGRVGVSNKYFYSLKWWLLASFCALTYQLLVLILLNWSYFFLSLRSRSDYLCMIPAPECCFFNEMLWSHSSWKEFTEGCATALCDTVQLNQ